MFVKHANGPPHQSGPLAHTRTRSGSRGPADAPTIPAAAAVADGEGTGEGNSMEKNKAFHLTLTHNAIQPRPLPQARPDAGKKVREKLMEEVREAVTRFKDSPSLPNAAAIVKAAHVLREHGESDTQARF